MKFKPGRRPKAAPPLFTPEQKALIGTASDRKLAEMWGRSLHQVRRERDKLSRSPYRKHS